MSEVAKELPKIEIPQRYGDLLAFRTLVDNGAYGMKQAELKQHNQEAGNHLAACNSILFDAMISPDASDEKKELPQEVIHAATEITFLIEGKRREVETKKSLTQRISENCSRIGKDGLEKARRALSWASKRPTVVPGMDSGEL